MFYVLISSSSFGLIDRSITVNHHQTSFLVLAYEKSDEGILGILLEAYSVGFVLACLSELFS